MPPHYLTFSEENKFCDYPFVASCLFPMVAEPVPLGFLGGQSIPPKQSGAFNGGVQIFTKGASFYHKTVNFIIVDFIVSTLTIHCKYCPR